jgi:acetyl esterase/lipase
MCDFSEYGGPSEEWLNIEKTLPVPFFNFGADPKEIQATVNGNRVGASAKLMEHLGPHVRMTDHSIPTRDGSTIEARSYRAASKSEDEALPAYLHFHGGGFIFGTLDGENAACANTAINTGAVVVNVNYRHTPEHTFPTAWNDSQDAFVWLHKNTDKLRVDRTKVAVGGISAGAQLTASLVLEKHLGKSEVLNNLPEIAAQVLLIPPLSHHETYADDGSSIVHGIAQDTKGRLEGHENEHTLCSIAGRSQRLTTDYVRDRWVGPAARRGAVVCEDVI